MLDPGLPDDHFRRDHVTGRETIFGPDDLLHITGASGEGKEVRFRGNAPLRIILPCSGKDFSAFDGFELAARNRTGTRLLLGITLVHEEAREGGPPPPQSFSGGREPLDSQADCRLFFPQECFGRSGASRDPREIATMELLVNREKTSTDQGDIEVTIHSLQGVRRELPPGPRLTSAGLRGLLDDSPSDEPPRQESTDTGSALLRNLYSSRCTAFDVPPPVPYPTGSGEEILSGWIMGRRVGWPVGWGSVSSGILEWDHFLHRHHFIRELLRSLLESGDKRFAAAVDRTLEDWITTFPPPVGSNGGASPSWETLSVAWRLREWLWIAGCAWPNPAFRDETRELMLRSIWEHARSLMDHRGHPNNWIMVESAALALAGLCFPVFAEASSWFQEGVERLAEEFRAQFFEDGVHFEISPMYHSICVHGMLEVKRAAEAADAPLPQIFSDPLERSLEYLAALCRPDFTWPSINDSGSADGDFTGVLRLAGEVFGRDDLLWVGTKGALGTPPSDGSKAFPHAGIAVMRSGWSSHGNQLVFRAGPAGASHVHRDVLSIDLTALGVPRLCDPGITAYAPDPLTDYYRSPQAHCMLLVDGKSPRPASSGFADNIRPGPFLFTRSPGGELEAATGLCGRTGSGAEADLTVLRSVIFVMNEYWVVQDTMICQDDHELTACWQFSPGRVEIDIETFGIRCVEAAGPEFRLVPALGGRSVEIEKSTAALKPPRGWISLGGKDIPATLVRYNVACTGPSAIFWILFPCSREEGLKVQVREQKRLSATLKMEFKSGAADVLSIHTPDPLRLGQDGEASHGKIVLERLDAEESVVLSVELGRGEGPVDS